MVLWVVWLAVEALHVLFCYWKLSWVLFELVALAVDAAFTPNLLGRKDVSVVCVEGSFFSVFLTSTPPPFWPFLMWLWI